MSEGEIDPGDGKAVGDAVEAALGRIYEGGVRTAAIERALYLGILYIVRVLSGDNNK